MFIHTDEIQEIIDEYNTVVLGIEKRATASREGRAYGGIVRAGKRAVES